MTEYKAYVLSVRSSPWLSSWNFAGFGSRGCGSWLGGKVRSVARAVRECATLCYIPMLSVMRSGLTLLSGRLQEFGSVRSHGWAWRKARSSTTST